MRGFHSLSYLRACVPHVQARPWSYCTHGWGESRRQGSFQRKRCASNETLIRFTLYAVQPERAEFQPACCVMDALVVYCCSFVYPLGFLVVLPPMCLHSRVGGMPVGHDMTLMFVQQYRLLEYESSFHIAVLDVATTLLFCLESRFS